MFFSAQSSQDFLKLVQNALPSIHLGYVNKVQVIILRGKGTLSSISSSPSKSNTQNDNSPTIFGNDDIDDVILSLLHVTEVDANAYEIESVLKQWMHDHSTDSDHLRLNVGHMTLRCDLRECMLNAEALPVTGQYSLYPDAGTSQHPVRPSGQSKQSSSSKVPIYAMEAVAAVNKEGVCESLLFGHSYIATATRCWKIDWDELDKNQQLFAAVARYLYDKGLLLLARKQTAQIMSSEKVLPTGFFLFFPSRNALLVKSVAPGELMLPAEEIPEKEVSEEFAMEARECIESLEYKFVYNPLSMASGLYTYLSSSMSKRSRPTTSFVTPIVAHEGGRLETKKRKKPITTAEVRSIKRTNALSFGNDFMAASNLLKAKFSNSFQ